MYDSQDLEIIDQIRGFNRFYTQQIGLLNEGLLGSGYTLTEARVLFELAARGGAKGEGVSPSTLVEELDIDPGYLSRMIKRFDAQGLLVKERSETDGRRIAVSLSGEGAAIAGELDQASQRDIGAMLGPLSRRDREILVRAMQVIELILTPLLHARGNDVAAARGAPLSQQN